MNLQLIACDLITAKNDKVYLLELCPALSCSRNEPIELLIQALVSTMAKVDHGLKLIQPPQEPDPHNNLLSHFNRDANDYVTQTQSSSRLAVNTALGLPVAGHVSLVTKNNFRQYFSDVIQNKQLTPHMFWAMYFRDGIHQSETADKFAIVLQKTFKRIRKRIPTFSVYPLTFACEQDKVLFWQLLQLKRSPLVVPKEIFRLSSFSEQQKIKMANFIKDLPSEKFLMKPTNANLSSGILVIKRNQLIEVVSALADYIKQSPNISPAQKLSLPNRMKLQIADNIKKIICPNFDSLTLFENQLIDIETHKFVNFWCKFDLHCVMGTERDFFLIEAYIAPKIETVITSQPQEKSAVACRAFLMSSNHAPKPNLISLSAKSAYDKTKLTCEFDFISSSDNYYSYNDTQAHPKITRLRTNRGERDSVAKANVTEAFSNTKSWLNALLSEKVSIFIQEIARTNPNNQELLEYIKSPAITDLNLENTGFCWHCFKMKANDNFKQCTRCKVAKYCDGICQKNDWKPYHKHECAIISL